MQGDSPAAFFCGAAPGSRNTSSAGNESLVVTDEFEPGIVMRPFRFSLRSLLAAMLVMGVALGVLGRITSASHERREVIARLGYVVGTSEHFEDYPPPEDVCREKAWYWHSYGREHRWENPLLWLFGMDLTPNHPIVAWCNAPALEGHNLAVLDQLQVVVLTEASDDDLARLGGLPDLRYLILPDYRGSAEGLRSLERVKRLGQLSISGPLGSEELEALGSLPGLYTLSVDFSQLRLDETPADDILVTRHMKRAERGLPECTVRRAIGPHF